MGYAALDWYDINQSNDLVLYEMFVPREFRHRGVGSRILAEETERLAAVSRLFESSFDALDHWKYYPKEKLKGWYEQQEYQEGAPRVGSAMAKTLP